MLSPIHAPYCDWRMVGSVKKFATPTCVGCPSRNEANEFESRPYCDRPAPVADIVTPGPKKAAPFGPNVLLHIASRNPSERMRRMSTPHFTLCIEECQPQFHTQLKVLSTPFIGTYAGAPIGARPLMLIPTRCSPNSDRRNSGAASGR